MTKLPRVAVIGLLAVVLSGCAVQAGDGASGPSASTAPTASREPSTPATGASVAPTSVSSPPATAPATQSTAGITDTGVLDISVGKPVSAGSPSVKWSTKVCGGGAGTWVPTTATSLKHRDKWDFTITPKLSGTSSTGATKSDPVDVIVIGTPALSTAAGIHVGSTRDELEAAYPKFSAVYKNDDKRSTSTDLYVLENDSAQVVFEVTRAGTSEQIDGSTDNTVRFITIQPSSRKAFSITGGDSYSGCFA